MFVVGGSKARLQEHCGVAGMASWYDMEEAVLLLECNMLARDGAYFIFVDNTWRESLLMRHGDLWNCAILLSVLDRGANCLRNGICIGEGE